MAPRKPAKKATTKRKTTAKKATTRKTTAKRAPARKTAAKKATTRKTTARKTTAKKATTRKTTARKATAKKATTRKPAAKKPAAKKAPVKLSTIKKKLTKTQTLKLLSEMSDEFTQKQVGLIFVNLKNIIMNSLKKGGVGEIVLPELGIKVRRAKKKATKGRMGRNPRTGEEVWIEPKPARTVIRLTALKALKETIA